VANVNTATAFVSGRSGESWRQRPWSTHNVAAARRRLILALLWGLSFGLLLLPCQPTVAASNKVRLTNLTDVAFGTLSNFGSDAVQSQSVCLFADTTTNGYNIVASGSGAAGAFQLASGLDTLAYEVQWSSSAGQTSGVQLAPSVPLTGQSSTATQQACSNGPANTASLIVIVRSTALSSAAAGSYSGTLTLVVGPE